MISQVSPTFMALHCVIHISGHKAAFSAGQRHKTTFRVSSCQVVIISRWCVRRRPKERSVLDIRPSVGEVWLALPSNDVVDVRAWAVASFSGCPVSWFLLADLSLWFLPACIEKMITWYQNYQIKNVGFDEGREQWSHLFVKSLKQKTPVATINSSRRGMVGSTM